MPPHLRSGMERLAGYDLSAVRVAYNSPRPGELGARAFTQGRTIHVGPGQERHLPHEAWHAVQQIQRRVAATGRTIDGLMLNDQPALEREADVMGARALRLRDPFAIRPAAGAVTSAALLPRVPRLPASPAADAVAQAQDGWLESSQKIVVGVATGKATGDIGVDVVIKVLRSHIAAPNIETLLRVLDAQYAAPLVQEGISYLASSLTSWAVPVYNLLQGTVRVFRLLPEPVQTLILFFVASRLRRIAGLVEGWMVSGEQVEAAIELLFVGDAYQSFQNVMTFVNGLATSPLTYLYQYATGGGLATTTEEGPETTGTGGGDVPSSLQKPAQKRIDTLFDLDLQILKLDVGKPKLRSGAKAPLETAQEETDPEASPEQVTLPGGLALPFNFSLDLFGKSLKATEVNELVLPWSGGFFLHVPRAALNVSAGVGDLFTLQAIVVEPLVVTQDGIQTIGLGVEGLDIAKGAVDIRKLSGTWSKKSGFLIRGDAVVTVMSHPIDARVILSLASDGAFKFANVVIGSKSDFWIVPDILKLTNPKFSGKVKTDTGVSLVFSGTLDLTLGGTELLVEALSVGYDGAAEGGGGFVLQADTISFRIGQLALALEKPRYDRKDKSVRADLASLRFGKKDDDTTEESSWLAQSGETFDWTDLLKVAPRIELAVPDVRLRKGLPHFTMGKPQVAVIAMKVLGLEADLDFRKKQGSLAGKMAYSAKIPVLSLPIPIVPGLEAFVDIDVSAGIKGALGGSLAKGAKDDDPWKVTGHAGLGGEIAARLAAGVQVGSQLAAALAVGLYAEGKGVIDSRADLAGGVVLDQASIAPVEGDPMRATYRVTAEIVAGVGLVVKAKALYVVNKTLYEREFKRWTIGSYELGGSAQWTGTEWRSLDEPKGEFQGGKLNEPPGDDRAVDGAKEARALLLETGLAIAGGAELRRELVEQVIAEYRTKDEEVYRRLDEASHSLAAYKSERYQLGQEFLGALRHYGTRERLLQRIQELDLLVANLKGQYREVLLVLVNVERAIKSVADTKLDLGTENLADHLDRIYRLDDTFDAAEAEQATDNVKRLASQTV